MLPAIDVCLFGEWRLGYSFVLFVLFYLFYLCVHPPCLWVIGVCLFLLFCYLHNCVITVIIMVIHRHISSSSSSSLLWSQNNTFIMLIMLILSIFFYRTDYNAEFL